MSVPATGTGAVVVADHRSVVAQGLAEVLSRSGLAAVAVSTAAGLAAAVGADPTGVVVVLRQGGPLRSALGALPSTTRVVVVGAGHAAGPAGAASVQLLGEPDADAATLARTLSRLLAGGPPASPAGRRVVPVPDRLAALTPRERAVLDLMSAGRETAEIAADLAVTVNTVRTHVNSLLHKLGVRSRLRAVALFAEPTHEPGQPR